MESFNEEIERDLSKCRKQLGYRSDMVIAEDHNKKELVVTRRKVASLPTFMGL